MQGSTRHGGVVASRTTATDLILRIVWIGLLVLLGLAPQVAAAGARSDNAGWEDMSRLGTRDKIDRAFLEGIEAYQQGDYTRAAKLWRVPAEQGHALAQYNLGVAYATGQGLDADLARAARWWRSAGYQGHTAAQYNLGLLYSRGQGVERNFSTARMWWYMAAMSGDPAAQYHLGALAATGQGETQNFTEAAWWWTRSAAQGYDHAVKGLEILKEHGRLEVSRQ